MSGQVSIKKNIGFQTAYQILNTCLPLITAPYLARVLGAEQLGVYSFTSSVVAYFVIIAMLGTVNYGTRSIAANKSDRMALSDTFWGIYLLQCIMTSIVLVAYVVYLIAICKDNKLIATIQIISIIDCFFNINWLFFGLEKFQITVTRSFFIRIITLVTILVVVKTPSDLWKYTVIMIGGTLLSNLVLWLYVPKIVIFKIIPLSQALHHLKPNLLLFLPLIAMSVYHTMDKTMLGILSTYEQSGFYYNADKIVNISVGVISGISTVLLPRMSSLISSGKNEEADNLFKVSLEGTVLVGVSIAFGIAAIAKEFIPVFFGHGYEDCVGLTIVLAPVLIIKSFSFTARYQYLIPHNKEKTFTMSVIAGAITNLFANYFLIPRMGAMGAVIGTLLAELVACIWQFMTLKVYISLKRTIVNCFYYMTFGLVMFAIVRVASIINAGIVIKLIFEISTGIVTYIALCLIIWHITHNNIARVFMSRFPQFNKRKKGIQ